MKLKERNSKNKRGCVRPSLAHKQKSHYGGASEQASESTEWVAVKEMSGFPCAPQQQQATSHAPDQHPSIPPYDKVILCIARERPRRFVRRARRKLIIISICDLFINILIPAALLEKCRSVRVVYRFGARRPFAKIDTGWCVLMLMLRVRLAIG